MKLRQKHNGEEQSQFDQLAIEDEFYRNGLTQKDASKRYTPTELIGNQVIDWTWER